MSRIATLVKEVNMLTRLNVFTNTRKREYVEARALLMTLLRKYFKYRLADIQNVFHQHGYPVTHATIIHGLKSFDMYLNYSEDLKEWYHAIVLDLSNDVGEARIDFIIPKLKYLSDDDLLVLTNQVKEMYEEAIINMND